MADFENSDTPKGKKRPRFNTLSPEETKDFKTLFTECLKDPVVLDSFKVLLEASVVQQFKERDGKIEQLEKRVADLEKRCADADQYSRRPCLVIANVPESEDENTDKTVLDIAAEIGVKVDLSEISRSHRLPTRNKRKKNRDIVVRFVTYNLRKKYYDAKKKLKDSQVFKNVYINEHLTEQRHRLFYLCRSEVKNNRFLGTWTRDGRIMIKYKDPISANVEVRALTSLNDLGQILPDHAPRPEPGQLNRSFMDEQ
jgi:hypothetical protein